MQLQSNGACQFADDHAAEDSYHQDIEMECAHLEEDQDTQMHGFSKLKDASATRMEEPILKSKALRWHMPIIGEVPMSK